MEVIFKANDGRIFRDATECVKYEATLEEEAVDEELPMMFDISGESTPSDASVIIATRGEQIRNFEKQGDVRCEVYNGDYSAYDGVVTVFAFDSGEGRFVEMDSEIIDVLTLKSFATGWLSAHDSL